MSDTLEAAMVILFGLSWPTSIYKSYQARTAKGKSLIFLILIFMGYFLGIVSKIVSGRLNYVTFFYILNVIMIVAELLLYKRNCRLDTEKSNG